MRLDTPKKRGKLFPLRWWLQLTCLFLLLAGIVLWRPPAAPLETSTTTLQPGLTLRKFTQKTTVGPVQIYVVRGEKATGWKLNMALSQGSVMQRETVSQIAAREAAPVAVNGGFFAYDGAALGAVKKEGEWIRLPWKNRTALGLKKDGTTRVANLHGAVKIEINGAIFNDAALNGSASADGMAVLTPHYGTTYNLRAGESALEITDGKIDKTCQNRRRQYPRQWLFNRRQRRLRAANYECNYRPKCKLESRNDARRLERLSDNTRRRAAFGK